MSTKLESALIFAIQAHSGQFRKKSNLDFVTHPLAVMAALIEVGVYDETILVAAVLHDVLEDCPVSPDEINRRFGKEVLDLVLELTYDEEEDGSKQAYLEYLAADASAEAGLIKCLDRLCNSNDYAVGGDSSYAHKYFAKAACLFDTLLYGDRAAEFEAKFPRAFFRIKLEVESIKSIYGGTAS